MVIKKNKILLILFNLIFCIVRAQKSNIYIALIDATTPYSISCSNLLDAFPETIKKVKLNDKQSKEIYLLTSVLKKNDNKPYTNIRYKGEICFNKKRFNFCGDQASILINGQYYETSKDLFEYIKKLRKK